MKRSTHNVFSLALCLWVSKLLHIEPVIISVLLSLMLTVFINWFIDSVAGHKGFRRTPHTHSILGALIISLLLSLGIYAITLLLGILMSMALLTKLIALALTSAFSHLLLDIFTANGIALLWPFKKRRFLIIGMRYDDPMLNAIIISLSILIIFIYMLSLYGIIL